MAADRPYGEFYDFYSVSPEYFGYTLAHRPDDRDPKSKIYISELTVGSYEYITVAYVTMHCTF
jgi:hypothetical protein